MVVYEIVGGLVVLALIVLGVWKFTDLLSPNRRKTTDQ